MTDKMLPHPGDPFPALTDRDVTVIALPVDDHATTQELIAGHGLRSPAGHGAGASAIADAPAPSQNPRPAVPEVGCVLDQNRHSEPADRDVWPQFPS